MPLDVVVVGSVNADLFLTVARHPHPGETLLGGSGLVLAGGKGANQAVAAARWGAATAMVGAVGSDANAAVAVSEFASANVDLAAVAHVPGATGLAVVTLSDDGENTIVVVPGANATVTVEAVDRAAGVIRSARVCLLQAEIPLTAVARAAEVAASAGVRVVLNLAPASKLPLETLRLADPLVVNEHEAALVLGWLADGELAGPGRARDLPAPGAAPGTSAAAPPTDHASALALARALLTYRLTSVVITLGGAGAVGVGPDGEWSLPARDVSVRDTTGAGDAFVGALAARLADGSTIADAAAVATRVAAFSVQHLGAQASYPWKGDPLP